MAATKLTVRTPNLGRRIRLAREAMKPAMTQGDLGKHLFGVEGNHVSRIERGLVTPPAKAYDVFVRVLNKPRDYFVDEPIDDAATRSVEMDDSFAGHPHFRLLTQSEDWKSASPKARAFVEGLAHSGGDLLLREWMKELEDAEKNVKRGLRLDVTRDALGRDAGEEDAVVDPDEAR